MKIGYFITARLKSSRLKHKITLPLNGNSVLDHVINRCKAVKGIDDVVLCTSTNSQDSPLYDYALKHKIKYYMGSEGDVLKRLMDAAKYYNFDAFLSITADNPLHSIYIAGLMADWVKKTSSDFIFVSGMPIGLAPYYINTKALEIAIAMKEKSDTEIWGPFVNRPDFFKIGYLNFTSNLFPDGTRLTCDYLEDYKLILTIYNKFNKDYCPSIFEISQLIEHKIVKLTNKNIQQISVSQKVLDEIFIEFDLNKKNGLEYAKSIEYNLQPGENNLNIIL